MRRLVARAGLAAGIAALASAVDFGRVTTFNLGGLFALCAVEAVEECTRWHNARKAAASCPTD